ncbi:MAG TPA: FAD-binding oxidoreductase [Candidatus Altiarchaeales archaeon]|nr:FAD-binding oxidoreductase [Candidatus Altiarchaeales archaeon]
MDKYVELKNLLGDRITFDKYEKEFYSRDLAPIPSIFTLMYRPMPDTVVRPVNTTEVSEIMKFANKHKIPVTPRGAATSALAGAVPTKGGIVMDLSSLNKNIELDEKESIVRVDAGVVWNELEKYLNNKGFHSCRIRVVHHQQQLVAG